MLITLWPRDVADSSLSCFQSYKDKVTSFPETYCDNRQLNWWTTANIWCWLIRKFCNAPQAINTVTLAFRCIFLNRKNWLNLWEAYGRGKLMLLLTVQVRVLEDRVSSLGNNRVPQSKRKDYWYNLSLLQCNFLISKQNNEALHLHLFSDDNLRFIGLYGAIDSRAIVFFLFFSFLSVYYTLLVSAKVLYCVVV